MANKPQQIRAICTKSSRLTRLTQRTQQLSKLNYILQQVMPPQFSAHCQLANVSEHTLIIHTDNASYASLLRFQAKTICQALSEHLTQPVTKLEVKVKPKFKPLETVTSSRTSIPKKAAEALMQTAETMDDGPLKIALEKLAKRQQKK